MRIAVAQIATRAGDFDRTGERLVEQSKRAAAQGVELLVFPVATLTGPFAVPQAEQRGLLMDVSACLMDLAGRVACSCLVPIVTTINGTPTTEVFLLADGDAVPLHFEAVMRSVLGGTLGPGLLTGAGEGGMADPPHGFGPSEGVDGADEFEDVDDELGAQEGIDMEEDLDDFDDEAFEEELERMLEAVANSPAGASGLQGSPLEDAPGGEQPEDPGAYRFASFTMGGLRFVVASSFDDLYELVDFDYEMDAIIFLPAEGFEVDNPSHAYGAALAESAYRQDVRMCGAWLVAAGSLGCYDNAVYTGGSFVLSPQGELMAVAPSFEEALVVADVVAPDEVPDAPTPQAGPLEPEIFDRSFFTWEALAFGLREYVHNLGRTDVALPLDGTLGACALAVLACDALGPTHVHALLATPLAGTSLAQGKATPKGSAAWRQVVDAAHRERSCRRLSTNLRLELVERSERLVGSTATLMEDAYTEEERLAAADLEEGVAHAELAALAARTGALTLSAHDKTWLALEARAGGSAADLLPFGDLYRTDVLELARMRNVISPVIPDLVALSCDLPCVELEEVERTTPPVRPGSAGPGNPPDIGLLHLVDVMLAGRVEWGHGVSELTETHHEEGLAIAVLGQMARHAPARAAAGVILRVGSADLDEDRLPYAMAWHDVARPVEEPLDAESFLDALRGAAAAYAQGNDGAPQATPQAAHGSPARSSMAAHATQETTDIMSYLRDLADELGLGSGPGSFDGHIATDGEGHFGFGGFSDGSPFSEN